jgi:predicted DNA-binding mobile mystery protein A
MLRTATYKARSLLDAKLAALQPAERWKAPPKGWVKAIRQSLGMSGVQLARRLAISPQSVDALERSEANGKIQLDTLRRAAEAMDCTLVYALVPRTSLDESVRSRATALARSHITRVAHTMKLEAQEVGDSDLEEQIDDYIREHIADRDVWNSSK